MTRRKRAFRAGYITIHRDAIRHLDHELGLSAATCWTLVRLMGIANFETGIVVCSIRWLALEFNCNVKTVRRHLVELKAHGLIDWIDEATNQNVDGQLAIPGFDWLSGVDGAEPLPRMPLVPPVVPSLVPSVVLKRDKRQPTTSEKEPLRTSRTSRPSSTSKPRISKNGNADLRDTEEQEPKPPAKTEPPKTETPEDWERARAKAHSPEFLALLAEEESARTEPA
jgi:hypothetical protein